MKSNPGENLITTDDDGEVVRDKPEYTKTIESFDINNITPENIEYMHGVIQNFFRDNFPVKEELVEQLPSHTFIMDAEEYSQFIEEVKDDTINLDELNGFYDSEHNMIVIDKSKCKTPGELFTTMFHESLHFVGEGGGAGLRGQFQLPPEEKEDEEFISLMKEGLFTLLEGTTHLITLASVVGKMNFDESEGMRGYAPQWTIMREIWERLPEEKLFHAFFEMSMEDLRVHFEKTASKDDIKGEINLEDGAFTGEFACSLANLGIITNELKETRDFDGVLADVERATEYYISCTE